MRAIPGDMSNCALASTGMNPSKETDSRKLPCMAHLARATEGFTDLQLCRCRARLAGLLRFATPLLSCAHDTDYALVEEGLADLGHEWWFSATWPR
jgi:hypothetical protein